MNQKVSVIIPTLNEEKLVERLLRQFDEQLRKSFDIELIVSDGGSVDRTIEICERYADKVVKKDNRFKQNISRGRNTGAWLSQGDVLIFLNADVIIADPHFLIGEAVRSVSEGNAALACRVQICKDEERIGDKLFHGFYNNYVRLINRIWIGMGRGECHIISRKAFFESGGYDESLAAGEDFELYHRLRKYGRVIFRNDLLVYESPRRYRKYGYARVFLDWAGNSLSVFFFKKSISSNWEAVR
ncbi:MAG: glycosyltransferase [Ignavibacteria bacterium]|nr:glycosyltransferase [Ignavibacteria bacterium]